jgi:UDP-GlcNAc:undecaprenyl-phosphate/decaprenyl-phosphate GlcNAc-1-phosphate transferase
VDKPDIRKLHTAAVARVGGIAIFLAAVLAIIPLLCLPNGMGHTFGGYSFEIVVLLVSSTFIFAVGLYDDLKGARVRLKLLVEILATVAVITAGICIDTLHIRGLSPINLGWLGYLITFCWIIGITNAINLIDGLDGLAAGISSLACGVIAILSMLQGDIVLALIMLALLGSLTGFLCFNFHPARIFMGDSGSLFLGFMIATASVLTAAKSEALIGIGLPILVLGIPILDTLLSMLRRFIDRRGIMSPDRGHFHHRLIDLGFKQHHIAVFAYIVTAGITGLGFFMTIAGNMASVGIFLICLTLLLVLFRIIGSVKLSDVLSGIELRLTLTRAQALDQKKFEEAQLHFRDTESFNQWWGCVCTTAHAFNFDHVSLESARKQNNKQDLAWKKDIDSDTDILLEDLLQIRIPIKHRHSAQSLQMVIQVKPNGSLETVGRRIALFTRLADEFGQLSPNADTQEKYPAHSEETIRMQEAKRPARAGYSKNTYLNPNAAVAEGSLRAEG